MSQKAAKRQRKAERLKAWKVDTSSYDIQVPVAADGRAKDKKVKFDVKESLASILFNRELRLTVDQTFEAKALADKIRQSNNHVLLDNKEMGMLREAYNIIRGPAEHELEFLRRIRDAEEISVAEIKAD